MNDYEVLTFYQAVRDLEWNIAHPNVHYPQVEVEGGRLFTVTWTPLFNSDPAIKIELDGYNKDAEEHMKATGRYATFWYPVIEFYGSVIDVPWDIRDWINTKRDAALVLNSIDHSMYPSLQSNTRKETMTLYHVPKEIACTQP